MEKDKLWQAISSVPSVYSLMNMGFSRQEAEQHVRSCIIERVGTTGLLQYLQYLEGFSLQDQALLIAKKKEEANQTLQKQKKKKPFSKTTSTK